mgnify:CR=1 FL=1
MVSLTYTDKKALGMPLPTAQSDHPLQCDLFLCLELMRADMNIARVGRCIFPRQLSYLGLTSGRQRFQLPCRSCR